jgi:hypothetical protein
MQGKERWKMMNDNVFPIGKMGLPGDGAERIQPTTKAGEQIREECNKEIEDTMIRVTMEEYDMSEEEATMLINEGWAKVGTMNVDTIGLLLSIGLLQYLVSVLAEIEDAEAERLCDTFKSALMLRGKK